MEEGLKLAIADDHQLVTRSLSDFLTANLHCTIIFTAANGQELVDKMLHHKVDIVLLDISMPVMDGFEALRIIRARNGEVRIIVLTMSTDEITLQRLLKLKVNGYLPKSASGEELLTAIQDVNRKGHYFNEKFVEVMYRETSAEPGKEGIADPLELLDDVDLDILRMLSEELTSKEMSKQLKLSYRSVEGRRKRLLHKVGVKNQVGLVLFAIRKGIIKL